MSPLSLLSVTSCPQRILILVFSFEQMLMINSKIKKKKTTGIIKLRKTSPQNYFYSVNANARVPGRGASLKNKHLVKWWDYLTVFSVLLIYITYFNSHNMLTLEKLYNHFKMKIHGTQRCKVTYLSISGVQIPT